MAGKIKQIKQAIKILEVANAVYKLMGAKGHITDIQDGPKLYSCKYSLDSADTIDFAKLIKNMGDNIATLGNKELTIEIPKTEQRIIELSSLLSSPEFKKTKNILPIILGVDTIGKPMIMDLGRAPHILVGGQAGSGKSTFLKTVYKSLSRKMKSAALKFLVIDSKNVDFKKYRGSEYLLKPVITNVDKGVRALSELVDIMDDRYQILKSAKVKNITEYQKKHKDMPYIIAMVDELSDLMARDKHAVESAIQQIAQKARAVGIHLIVATRDLSRGNISDIVRANLPTVIAFKTRDKSASVRILGDSGAEKLLQYGDVLLSNAGRIPVRLHPAYTR